jgi:hypothetical protein
MEVKTRAPVTMDVSGETRGARFARNAHRTRLYIYAGVAAALLVWLVLVSAILGVLLGMVLGALFHWRTRQPRG